MLKNVMSYFGRPGVGMASAGYLRAMPSQFFFFSLPPPLPPPLDPVPEVPSYSGPRHHPERGPAAASPFPKPRRGPVLALLP